MFRQYPHSITITTLSGSTLDSSGNWTVGTAQTVTRECRAEVNSKNGLIVAADGTQIRYDWVVYMPKSDVVTPGSQVEIKDGDRVLCKSIVKQFSQGQLNQRLWL